MTPNIAAAPMTNSQSDADEWCEAATGFTALASCESRDSTVVVGPPELAPARRTVPLRETAEHSTVVHVLALPFVAAFPLGFCAEDPPASVAPGPFEPPVCPGTMAVGPLPQLVHSWIGGGGAGAPATGQLAADGAPGIFTIALIAILTNALESRA